MGAYVHLATAAAKGSIRARDELAQLRGIVALAAAVVRDPDGESIVLLEQALIEAGELPGMRLPAQD